MRTRDFHGHPKYLELTEEELTFHSAKNRDYTKGGDPLGNFRRVADFLRNYPGLKLSDPTVVCLVYGLKQLDAALWHLSEGYEGEVESVDARLKDIHIYAKIARILNEEELHD